MDMGRKINIRLSVSVIISLGLIALVGVPVYPNAGPQEAKLTKATGPFDNFIFKSDLICKGKVVSRTEGALGFFGSTPIKNITAGFMLTKTFKGKVPSSEIRVKFQYYVTEPSALRGVPPLFNLEKGEECFLFLRRTEKKGTFSPFTPYAHSKVSITSKGFSRVHGRPSIHRKGKTRPDPDNIAATFKQEYEAAIREGQESVRALSVMVIGAFHNRSDVPFIVQILANDSSPMVRAQAVYGLQCMRGPAEVILSLVRALQNDPDTRVRTAAAHSLHNFEGPTAANALARSIREDPDRNVRLQALDTLNRMMKRNGDALEQIDVVIEALEDTDEKVQIKAARILGNETLIVRKAIPLEKIQFALKRTLRRSKGKLRRSILHSLARYGEE